MNVCSGHIARTSSPKLFEQGAVIRAVIGVNISTNDNPNGADIHFKDRPDETTWINWPVSGLSVCWWSVAGGSNFVRFYGAPSVTGTITVYNKNKLPIITFIIASSTDDGSGDQTGEQTSPTIINKIASIPTIINIPFDYIIESVGTTPIDFSLTGTLPAGLGFSIITATDSVPQYSAHIFGTPTVVGQYPITVTASNSHTPDDSESFIIDIAANTGVGVAPAISSPSTANGVVGKAFAYNITATGTTLFSFSTTNKPDWLSLSGTELVGIPDSPGDFTVTINVTNQTGTDSKEIVVTVRNDVLGTYTPNILTSINITQTADGRIFNKALSNTTQTNLDQNVIGYKTFHIGNIRTSEQRNSV